MKGNLAKRTMNLAFFASHNGSNMQAVIDACKSGFLNARLGVIISNNSASEALARAKREGIPSYHLSSKTHPDPKQLDQATLSILIQHHVELVTLAGYMKRLGEKTLAIYQGKVINIHPALLPKYGGQGMYGIHVHRAVLTAGETETGVTIHQVDQEYDHGAIVAQCRIPIFEADTAETLAERVLGREHTFLVETLKRIVEEEINLRVHTSR